MPPLRQYQVFICHRWQDDGMYGTLRQSLNQARYFRWKNLSVQADQRLPFRSQTGLRRAITRRVRVAEVLLVPAHSAGDWVTHELTKAAHYQVPVIAVIDPRRESTGQWVRTSLVMEHAVEEVGLDDPDRIVNAIRTHARSLADQGESTTGPAVPVLPAPDPAPIPERRGLWAALTGVFSRGPRS